MESKRLSKSAGMEFSHLPLKNGILAVMIVLSILVNAFIPRFAVSQDDLSTLSQIIDQQSTLLRFFSLSSLPLDIVNQLFADSQVSSGSIQTGKSEKKKEHKTNTQSDFSIISLEGAGNIGKSGSQRLAGKDISVSLAEITGFMQNSIRGSPIHVSPHPFIFCIILILFFLLPRSSVNDAAAIMNRSRVYTQLGKPSWVFLFPINYAAGRKNNE